MMNPVKTITSLAVAVLALGSASTIDAAPCALTDVYVEGSAALACAGAFDGNESLDDLNSLTNADWLGSDPNPLGDWQFGGKWDWDDGGLDDPGVLPAGAVISFSVGEFEIDISPYAEVVIAFKQATDYAYYYFQNDGDGSYLLSWASSASAGRGTPAGDVFSHISLFVRGEATVPEPATSALLGLGLIAVGLARRRRAAL